MRGAALLRAVNATSSAPADAAVLDSVADLHAAYSHFFPRGAAAERFFANKAVFDGVAAAAAALPGAAMRTGGNAALMAEYLATIPAGVNVDIRSCEYQ